MRSDDTPKSPEGGVLLDTERLVGRGTAPSPALTTGVRVGALALT